MGYKSLLASFPFLNILHFVARQLFRIFFEDTLIFLALFLISLFADSAEIKLSQSLDQNVYTPFIVEEMKGAGEIFLLLSALAQLRLRE